MDTDLQKKNIKRNMNFLIRGLRASINNFSKKLLTIKRNYVIIYADKNKGEKYENKNYCNHKKS